MEDYNLHCYNEKLYKSQYHNESISKFKFLITGGAGFIGSNIVEYLLRYNAGRIRILDNLSNGYFVEVVGYFYFYCSVDSLI